MMAHPISTKLIASLSISSTQGCEEFTFPIDVTLAPVRRDLGASEPSRAISISSLCLNRIPDHQTSAICRHVPKSSIRRKLANELRRVVVVL